MANANVDIVYEIYANNINDAIDAKNKIIANTLDDEKVHINIKTSGDVWTVVHYDNGTKISETHVTAPL